MRREQVELGGNDFRGTVAVYGHFGRPVVVFPSEQGRAWDFENNGMVDAVGHLVETGQVKFYCVDSGDGDSWADYSIPTEERARRHARYEQWIVGHVLPWASSDSGGASEFAALGCSQGAYHAANFALKRADLFPLALCLSGNYEPDTWHCWGELGDATYFNNPMAYVANFSGDHLSWIRDRVSLLLVVGQGAWEEHPTRALPSTRAFADQLRRKGIRHELDVWGHDVPHDWSSWRAQLVHHLPRFC
jgi:esterase/lipase superfamily enzyme